VVSTGFRCLKLILSNYIDKLSQENFITILHAIHKYASNEGENINNNLTAVGMFQNVADYTAKHSSKEENS
jgi:phage-related holin